MIKLICTNCGNSSSFELKEKNPHTGIYCKKCGNWIKWATKLEIEEITKQYIDEIESNNINKFKYNLNLNINLKLLNHLSGVNCLFYEITNQINKSYSNKINILREIYDFNSHSYIYSFGYFMDNNITNENNLDNNFVEILSFQSNSQDISQEN